MLQIESSTGSDDALKIDLKIYDVIELHFTGCTLALHTHTILSRSTHSNAPRSSEHVSGKSQLLTRIYHHPFVLTALTHLAATRRTAKKNKTRKNFATILTRCPHVLTQRSTFLVRAPPVTTQAHTHTHIQAAQIYTNRQEKLNFVESTRARSAVEHASTTSTAVRKDWEGRRTPPATKRRREGNENYRAAPPNDEGRRRASVGKAIARLRRRTTVTTTQRRQQQQQQRR